MEKILVIIPAYNEAQNIMPLLTHLKTITMGLDIVVINDGSTDQTVSLVCQCEGVRLIDLPINLGIGGAVQSGFLYAARAGYAIAVQVDGDGQHNPGYLSALVAPILRGQADMVIGSRFLEYQGFQSTFLRRAGIRYLQTLIWLLTRQQITDPTSGFRAYNANIINLFARYYPRDYPEPESCVTVIRRGFRVAEVPVMMNARGSGTSSINTWRTGYYFIKVSLAILLDQLKER